MNEEQKNLNQQQGHVAPQNNAEVTKAPEAPKAEPIKAEKAPEVQEVEPAKAEKAQEAPKVEPAKAEQAQEAPKAEPTKAEQAQGAPKVEPAKAEQAQGAPKAEPAKAEKAKEAPKAEPAKAKKAQEDVLALVPAETETPKKSKEPREAARKEKKKKRRVEDPPRYKKHEVWRAFTGILKFILILLLGMIIAYGSIAGAVFFAVGGLTIDMLQDWGIVGEIDYLTDTGEVDLTATTLLQLILDLNKVSENLGSYSVRTLMDHYGVVLSEETLASLPSEILEIPLDQLTSDDAVGVITENIKLGYLLAFFPDGLLAAPVKEKLQDRPLSLLTEGKYDELLADVYLGYFMGVNFDENDNVIYQNPDQYTMQETVAKLDVGSLLFALTNNGDLLGVMASDLGDQPVRPFISGIMSGALLEKMCEGRTIGDVLLPDPTTGQYTFSFAALSEGVYLGDTLGYTLVDGVWYSTYTDDGDAENDVKVSTMYAKLVGISLVDVINNEVSLDATFDGLYFGDLQSGYVRGEAQMGTDEQTGEPVVLGYEWYRGGERIGKVQEKLANVMVNTVLGGQLDIGAVLGDLMIGHLQGYLQDEEGKWYKNTTSEGGEPTREYVNAVSSALAGVGLSDVLNGQLDIAATLSSLYLGDLQGFEKKSDNKWYKTTTPAGGEPVSEYVGAVKNALADVSLSSVMNGELDIAATLEGLYLGDVQGFEKKSDNKWYKTTTPEGGEPVSEYVGAVKNALADLSLSSVMNGELDIAASLDGLYLGDVQGFEKKSDNKWYKAGEYVGSVKNALADLSLSSVMNGELDIAASLDGLYLGDVQGFEKKSDNKWYKTTTPEGGEPVSEYVGAVKNALADLSLSSVMNGELDVAAALDGLYLGDVQGFEKKSDNKWYKAGEYVGSVKNALANVSLSSVMNGEMDVADSLSSLSLGDVQGYVKGEGDKWYREITSAGGEPQLEYVGAVENALADIALSDVMNGNFSIKSALEGLRLGDAMNYIRGEVTAPADPTDPDSYEKYAFTKSAAVSGATPEAVTGAALEIANIPISHMFEGKIELEDTVRTLTLAEALGYVKVDTDNDGVADTWYESYTNDNDDTNDVKVTGIFASLADKKISDLGADTVNGLYLADVLGYKKTGEKWYDKDNAEVTGVLAALADKKVGELNGATINDLYLADVLGYKKTGEKWYDKDGAEVTGVLAALADKKVGELNGATINNLCLADVLGYHKVSDKWYDKDNVEVTGVLAAIADKKVGQLNGATFNDLYLSDVLGYHQIGTLWFDKDNNEVTGVLGALAGKKISELNSATINELTLADVMGYKQSGALWIDKNNNDVTGVLAALADKKIGELDSSTINGLKLAEVLSYKKKNDGKWYDMYGKEVTGILASLADKMVGELNGATINGILLGEVLGFEHKDTNADGKADAWYQNGAPAAGIMSHFADLSIGDLSNSQLVGECVKKMTLAEAMGYVKVDTDSDGVADTWYSQYSDDRNSTNDVKITGILAVLAGKKLSEIDSGTIETLSLGEVLGYTLMDTDNNGKGDTWYQNGAQVKGMMATLADLTIGEFSDSHKVSEKINDVYLYEILDYELVDGKWVSHNDHNDRAGGVLAHLLELKISEVKHEIDDMELGYAFGFYYDSEQDEWFTDVAHTKKPTGITAALADIRLTEAREKIDEMKIGTLLGYRYIDTNADEKADTWYSLYTDDGNSANDVKLSGLNLVFADMMIADLGNSDKVAIAMQSAKLGDALGYKQSGSGWYHTKVVNGVTVADTARPVTGVIGALCGNPIGSIESDIQGIEIGTMLNFTKKSDGWYDAANKKLNGVMAILANSNLDNVAGNINNMTVEDLWPERTGVLAAISDDVKLLELNTAVATLTVKQLRDVGVLSLNDTQVAKINMMLSAKEGKAVNIDTMGLPEFINKMLGLIPGL